MSVRVPQPDGNRLANVPILVVEDDLAGARLMKAMLATEGANNIRLARSAEEALTIVSEVPVRVVVTDIVLPGMSGLMLVRRLKSSPATCEIVIIAVTGLDRPKLKQEALSIGCAELLRKPVDFERLLGILCEQLAEGSAGAGGSERGTQ